MKRALLALMALASANAGATPSGHKWFTFPSYQVFAHTTINGMPANSFTGTVLPGVQNSFLTWTKTRVSCTSWVSTYTGTFTSPSGTAAVNGNDNVNHVLWLGGAQWRYSQATLGLTTTGFFQGSGEITDADMELNNNVTWADNGDFNSFDYQSVVTHEAGHFLGLDHSSDTSAVMYASIANGAVKRTLNATDLSDVCTVYPGNGMPGAQGSPCTMNTNCATGLVCRAPSSAPASKICTKDCTSGQACPTSLTCSADNNGGTSKACFQPAGSTDYCKFCADGTGCSSGVCLRDASGHNWCTDSCGPTAACAAGSSCLDNTTGGACTGTSTQCVCAPPAFKCPGQCTTAANCGASGFACVNGTCEATGNTGDRCEVSEYCKDCKVCIGSSSAAYCRNCCNSGADYCHTSTGAACTSTTCGAGETCVGVTNTQSAVCAPTSGADVCMACSATVACANGAACVAGRCHTSCTPANPGGCTACLDQGGGNGVCACTDEQARENDPCGVISPTQFFACVTGLACAGSPSKCHRQCDILNPASCPSGQTCTQAGAIGICVPGAAGSTCAACNGVACNAGNSCVQGVCRLNCNVNVKNGPCDGTCVDVGSGVNVCACNGEISPKGGFCGGNPIHACQAGLTCLNNVCVGACNPNAVPVDCPLGTECRLLVGSAPAITVCQTPDTGAGGGSGGSGVGGGIAGAGGGGGVIDNSGCGCGVETGLWPALGLLGLLRARRRRSA